jgi:hypothetical protein
LEIEKTLATKVNDYLTIPEIDRALAEAVKPMLSDEEFKKIKKAAVLDVKKTDQEIDAILTKATQQALTDITQRGYHRIMDHMASEFIDLGMAIYGDVPHVKAAFGPD